jgi:aminocarboxymuconate-semialdehyde decarboxylase
MIIDTPAHVVPGSLIETLQAERRIFPSVRLVAEGGVTRLAFAGEPPTGPIAPRLSDLEDRKQWLVRQRIDRQVVGGWTDVYGYELASEEGADWARFLNEHLRKDADTLAALTPLASVPLQHGVLAARVLDKALDTGFNGVMIGTQPKGGRQQSRRSRARPVLGDRLGAPRDGFSASDVHLWRRSPRRLRFAQCGWPPDRYHDRAGTALVLRSFDAFPWRYPRRLAWRRRAALCPRPAATQLHDPSGWQCRSGHGFRRLYFDTVLFEPQALHFLCDVAGSDKVVLGSDYPFPIGDPEPARVVEETPLTEAERRAILGGPAARIFHIDCGCVDDR